MRRLQNKTLWIGLTAVLALLISPRQTGWAGAVPAAGSLGAVASAPGPTSGTPILLSLVGGVNGGCGAGLFEFQRILPDGTSGNIFRVPAGSNFVVTDLDWSYVSPSGTSTAGTIQTARLFIQNLANPFMQERGMESTITLSNTGQGGTSTNATTGFVVSSKARICPDVFPGPMGPPFGVQHMIVRGFLN